MSKIAKVRLLKYGISGLVCAMIGVIYLVQYDFAELETLDWYRVLCDAFTLPGLLCVFAGLLVAVANEGALDGIGFVLSYVVNALIPGRNGKVKTYGDYVEEKRQKRTKGYGFLFITGGVFLAIALIFLVMFYSV